MIQAARRHPTGAFTLLEVMVAIAILALMTSATYAALVPALEGKARAEQIQLAYNRINRFVNRLDRELRGAYFGINPASTRRNCMDRADTCPYVFIGKNSGELDEVRFVTTALSVSVHRPSSDEALIAYFTGRPADTTITVPALFRQQALVHDRNSYTKYAVQEREVLPNITRFDLRYLNRGTEDEWIDDWDSTDEMSEDKFGHLPRAVEILIEYDDPDAGNQSLYTVTYIPASKPCKNPGGGQRPSNEAPGKRVGNSCP